MTQIPDDTLPDHGIAGWPYGAAETGLARPDRLPDGRPWPRLRVVTVADDDAAGLPDTLASVARQGYAELRHDVLRADPGIAAALERRLADPRIDALVFLRPGDLLAPGALAALALEVALTGVDAVAGLRVLFDRAVLGLDLPGTGDDADESVPFTGGEILWSRAALERAASERGSSDLAGGMPTPHRLGPAWAHACAAGGVARIGRPVLLQRVADGSPPTSRPGLAIVSLTGTGHVGGAGVAHRRLAEALALAGHRCRAVALADESPEAAAEWTDAFPRTEAAIRDGGCDLVLAGNLHGATRSLDVLARIARPAAVVLHDLFPLTGRCAHPRDCTRVDAPGCDAACPRPDEYPQLAPARIAPALAGKRGVLGTVRPLLLANSDWTAWRTRQLAPPAASVETVRLAFPTGVFRPQDRAAARRALGLPEADLLVLIASVIVDAPDKGFADLVDALRRVARPGIGFVAVGRLDDPGRLGLPNLHAAGPVADEARLAAWYGACDIHVTASRVETLGQTPIEAGLCGTPTLAYRAAGLTSAVLDGVSGRLVEPTPRALAAALEDLAADADARRHLGAFARMALESRFSPAAAALSLDAAFRAHGILPERAGRLRFAPALLGHFPFAAARHAGRDGTVPARSGWILRRLRRAKQRVLGRNLPLVLRRCLYLAARARGAVRHGGRAA